MSDTTDPAQFDPARFDDLVKDLETFADQVGTAPLGQVMARLPDALAKHRQALAMLERFKADIQEFEAATCQLDEEADPASGTEE